MIAAFLQPSTSLLYAHKLTISNGTREGEEKSSPKETAPLELEYESPAKTNSRILFINMGIMHRSF
jgi:hypothetical protein